MIYTWIRKVEILHNTCENVVQIPGGDGSYPVYVWSHYLTVNNDYYFSSKQHKGTLGLQNNLSSSNYIAR